MIAVILNDTSHYHNGCKKVIEYLISDLHSCGFTDIKLVGQDIKKIQAGDLSPLQDLVDEFGETSLKEFQEVFQKAIEIENKLVEITKQRINLENNLVSAQQKVLSAQMEAANIIAEFGGAAVSAEQQRQNILQSANTQSGVIGGITDLQSGSAAELRNRNKEINAQLANIDSQRQAVAGGSLEAGDVNARLSRTRTLERRRREECEQQEREEGLGSAAADGAPNDAQSDGRILAQDSAMKLINM